MIYLTYGDSYSGVFSSQVIDVCKYISSVFKIDVKLVCFVPYPTYGKDKKKIKSQYANSVIFPMLPSRSYVWKPYAHFFKFFLRKQKRHKIIIGRATFAANIALYAKGKKQKMVYDGRGAEKAQWAEYISKPISEIVGKLENKAINKSDRNIAVSNHLVQYWRDEFNYGKDNTEIIPCTLNSYFTVQFPKEEDINERRKELGYTPEDIIVVFSGGATDWQAVDKLEENLKGLLGQNEKVKVLFLSKFNLEDLTIYKQYQSRLKQLWVLPEEVYGIMITGDYGILYREESITNKVASPTKFAEYLSAGLKVIISGGIGDYSLLVAENKHLGEKVKNTSSLVLEKVSYQDKQSLNKYGKEHFSKSSFDQEYKTIIQEEIK